MQKKFEKINLFYLGKDSKNNSLTLYKSKNLTIHAAIIGPRESSRTGLGIGLTEEASIDNIPSIVINPKGDIGNLCLTFPEMNSDDFLSFIEPINAQNSGKSINYLARETASKRKEETESFGQNLQRVKKLSKITKNIYTPNSSASLGIRIFANFNVPKNKILQDSHLFLSQINSTVISLLSLADVNSNPIDSKEHLLLLNIFNFYCSKGIYLSLKDLLEYDENIHSLIADTQTDIEELRYNLKKQTDTIETKYDIDNYKIKTLCVKPRRSDVFTRDIALLWER